MQLAHPRMQEECILLLYPNSINTINSNLPATDCRTDAFCYCYFKPGGCLLISKNKTSFPTQVYSLWDTRSSKANIHLWNGKISTKWWKGFVKKNGIYTVLSSRKYISYREWLYDWTSEVKVLPRQKQFLQSSRPTLASFKIPCLTTAVLGGVGIN